MTVTGTLTPFLLLVVLTACGGESRVTGEPREADLALLDDMERDADAGSDPDFFTWRPGYGGHWWMDLDGSAEDAPIDEIVPPRGTSSKACHVSGSGLGQGGGLIGQLLYGQYSTIDVSAYSGLVFHARMEGASADLVVAMSPVFFGYFDAAARGTPFPSKTIAVSPEWQRFELPFDDFAPWNQQAVSIDFIVESASFDLWIDDVSFTCRGPCPTDS